MEQGTRWRSRVRSIILWAATAVIAFGIGTAGLTKFLQPDHWQALFVGWGYPPWFPLVVGAAEVGGAIALLVPRLASYAAMVLLVVMLSALVTLLRHPAGPLGWGATPTVYIVLLVAVGACRLRLRVGRVAKAA